MGFLKCGTCGKTRGNPATHVCRIGWNKAKGQTKVMKAKKKPKR